MAEFPAMPLWTDAYLADTTHLTTLEHGAYLLLLMAMWRNGGWLPNDDKKLGRFAHLGIRQWLRMKPTMMAFFKLNGDKVFQGRLEDELSAVRQRRESQAKKANAKWLKKRHSADAAACAGHMPTLNTIDSESILPTQSPTLPGMIQSPVVLSPQPSALATAQKPNGAGNGHDRPNAVKGCRMPADWDPGDAGRAWARSELKNPRVTDEWIEEETEKAKDWAWSTAGQKAVKVNWNRFWKNWLRTAHGRLRDEEARQRRYLERYQQPRH